MRLLLLLPFILLCLFHPAFAYEVSELKAAGLYEEFDPDRLTTLEKKFLQTGLAMEGLYKSPIDGLWGRGSQQALKLYAVRHGHNDTIPVFEVFALAMKTGNRFAEQKLEMFYSSFAKMSLLIPFNGIKEGERGITFANLKSTNSSIRYIFYRTSSGYVSELHQMATADKNRITKPRVIRRNNLRISSFKLANGRNVYIRSDYVAGQWSTIVLTAQERDKGLLTAVAWSITKGKTPNIYLPEGYLRDGVEKTATFVLDKKEEREKPGAPPSLSNPFADEGSKSRPPKSSAVPEMGTDPEASSSGTGFAVSANGDLLTNDHVTAGCSQLTVDGHEAVLKATDKTFDLALLHVPSLETPDFAIFAENPAPLNSDVTVAGYPLTGLLSGLNVTRGSVTAMKGIGGDSTRMQISAPVQPGNSGGPAMNAYGHVVGVVAAKLDAQRVADAIGDIPQNVNFAVRGSMAKLFLHQNGITPKTAVPNTQLSPEAIATRLTAITHFIECY